MAGILERIEASEEAVKQQGYKLLSYLGAASIRTNEEIVRYFIQNYLRMKKESREDNWARQALIFIYRRCYSKEEISPDELTEYTLTQERIMEIFQESVSGAEGLRSRDELAEFKEMIKEGPRRIEVNMRAKMTRVLNNLVKEGRIDEALLRHMLEGLLYYSQDVRTDILVDGVLMLASQGWFNLPEKGDIHLSDEGKKASFGIITKALLDSYMDERLAKDLQLKHLFFRSLAWLYKNNREEVERVISESDLEEEERRRILGMLKP